MALDIFFIIISFFIGILFGILYIGLQPKYKPNPNPKYRLGKKQKRVILEIETGHEYGVFSASSEQAAEEYLDYLNNKTN